jgi:hypothetical protein
MTKRKIQLVQGRVLVLGPMTPEAIRAMAEQVEAVIGGYPAIMIRTFTTTSRSVMAGTPRIIAEPARVLSIHRLFVRLDVSGVAYDLIPEQCPDLEVSYHQIQ